MPVHPFPGVRIQPVGAERYHVVKTRLTVEVGELYAYDVEHAARLADRGFIQNPRTVDTYVTYTVTLHPDHPGESESAIEQPKRPGPDGRHGGGSLANPVTRDAEASADEAEIPLPDRYTRL